MHTGTQIMSSYESNSNTAMVETMPLFASSWLALFYMLRKNYTERRAINEQSDETQSNMEDK
jgi:hypothetical protein